MKIAMFTNTYTPHVGGVSESVQQLVRECRALGNKVLVVAPQFDGVPTEEANVVRIPAFQHFNGSDFSVPVPVPGILSHKLDQFQPDIVHSHQPFLLGDTALRVSAGRGIPVVFTHHTRYEKYTHYVPGDSETMQRFVIELTAGYANLCDAVVAPSHSIANWLISHGVTRPIAEIPSGVDNLLFQRGDSFAARKQLDIPETAFVVGYVGRLAPEKGIRFLVDCVGEFLAHHPNTYFLCAGTGPSESAVRNHMRALGVDSQLVMTGNLSRSDLSDVYNAMDVFAFSSQSEAQGLSLLEAMAASKPVVALDAPGVRDLLDDGMNGLLIRHQDPVQFIDALCRIHDATPTDYMRLSNAAHETSLRFTSEEMAARTIEFYGQQLRSAQRHQGAHDRWTHAKSRIEEEWKIWTNVVDSAGHAIIGRDYHIF